MSIRLARLLISEFANPCLDDILKKIMTETTQYDVILHKVFKQYMKDIEKLMIDIKQVNNIKIKKIVSLRKEVRNLNASTLFIVIFLNSSKEVNTCINESMIINKKYHNNIIITSKTLYAAERYTSQCQF